MTPLIVTGVIVLFGDQSSVDGDAMALADINVTVTGKVPVAVLFSASLAVQVTVVGPTGKLVPDAGLQLTVGVETESVAVGGV
jgi:hypothetical protein